MRKRLKIIIVTIAICLGSLCILFVAGVALMFLLGLPFYLTGVYFECDPERMVSHLEKTFVIDFPEQQIKEVRAAKSFGWDHSVGFKIKFVADPNAVDRFLKSFPKEVNLYQYRREDDIRDTSTYTPKWFSEPITQGKEASPIFRSRDFGKAYSHLSLYIDTTNEQSFVVYIRGSYDSELDY
jgi:hypothetical protein